MSSSIFPPKRPPGRWVHNAFCPFSDFLFIRFLSSSDDFLGQILCVSIILPQWHKTRFLLEQILGDGDPGHLQGFFFFPLSLKGPLPLLLVQDTFFLFLRGPGSSWAGECRNVSFLWIFSPLQQTILLRSWKSLFQTAAFLLPQRRAFPFLRDEGLRRQRTPPEPGILTQSPPFPLQLMEFPVARNKDLSLLGVDLRT